MENRKLTYFFVIFTLAAAIPGAINAQNDIEIEALGKSGVILTYRPVVETELISDTDYEFLRFKLFQGISDSEPGDPVIPFRHVKLAVPEKAEPVLTVLEAEFITMNDVDIEVFQGMDLPDSLLNSDLWLRERPVEEISSGFFRLQKIAGVTFNPVQYNPFRKEARIARKISVRIDYNVSQATGIVLPDRITDSRNEDLYRSLLLNYDNGRVWRRKAANSSLSKSSQLHEGMWFTIPVNEEGIYKITYQDLVSSGIDPGSIDPRTMKIYNNGGLILSESIPDSSTYGMIENAIRIMGEEDGSFDATDYILFYGRGTDSWGWNEKGHELKHNFNQYTADNIYWFTYSGNAGKRMIVKQYGDNGAQLSTTGKGFYYLERESVKMWDSGSDWYMTELHPEIEHEYSVNLPGYIPDSEADFRFSFRNKLYHPSHGNSVTSHTLQFSIGSILLDPIVNKGNITRFDEAVPESGDFSLAIENISSNLFSVVYLDWIQVEYNRSLSGETGYIKFQPAVQPGPYQCNITNVNDGSFEVYNVSDFGNVYLPGSAMNGGSMLISDDLADDHQQYLGVIPDSYQSITIMEPVSNSDLLSRPRAADMLIIAPRVFSEAADRLKQHRHIQDGLLTEVVYIEDIFNEFGAGLPDPTAIRDFTKYAFDNWAVDQANPPRYLLLLGDGHWDYRGIRPDSDINRIPSFQYNSIEELGTRGVDDFFGYVSGNDYLVDIVIGRLPVKTPQMANDVVSKIIRYETEPEFGPWRTNVTYVADDEVVPTSYSLNWYESFHTIDSEKLANASYVPDFLDKTKIYLMEYPAVTSVTTASDKKPGAQDALIKKINDGTSIVTYVGHGNHRLLADEWVLNREIDMPRIQNGEKLFFFYIASCSFGKWDLPNDDSMAEMLMTLPDDGVIGIISANREVFASSNYFLADYFYKNLFISGTRETRTVGDALLMAKHDNHIYANQMHPNNQKYHLLGDPAFKFRFPENIFDSIDIEPDSLKAMARITMTADLGDESDFTGSAYLSVYDSENKTVHIMPNGNTVRYTLPGARIFRGSSTLNGTDNSLVAQFIVPRDITYGGKNGRLNLHVWNNETEGSIYLDNIPVGGTVAGIIDTEGPEMEVLFNERRFISGDIVRESPELFLNLSDPQGINITGEIGHKIEFSLNNNATVIDLSDAFEYDSGSFTSGTSRMTLSELKEGQHTFYVRAWDNYNNSTIYRGIMNVVDQGYLIVKDVYNYPNPFSESTQFTAQVNFPSDVEIKIFTVSGRLVKTIPPVYTGSSSFFFSNDWDGTDDDGDRLANGTYIYKLIARSNVDNGTKQVEKTGKIVIMR
ncbi:type IX secretion system sortase PorU [candidate division KSB1 bacterium]